MQQSFENVEDPRLTIGKVTVAEDEKRAKAEVRTSATGQTPSAGHRRARPASRTAGGSPRSG